MSKTNSALSFFGIEKQTLGNMLFKFSRTDLLGHSLSMTWIFLLNWGYMASPVDLFSDYETHLFRLVMLGFSACSFVLIAAFSKLLSLKYGDIFSAMVIVLCGPPNCLLPLFIQDMSWELSTFSWAISALPQVFLLLLWSQRLTKFNKCEALAIATSSFLYAGIAFLIISYLQLFPSLFVTAFLPVISVILFFVNKKQHTNETDFPITDNDIRVKGTLAREKHSKVPLADRFGSLARRAVFRLVYSVALGFVGCYATMQSLSYYGVLAIGLASSLAGFAMLYIIQTLRIDIAQVLMNLFLPAIVICMFPLLMFSSLIAKLICIVFLFFLFSCFEILNLTAIPAENSGKQAFIVHYVKGRVVSGVGIFTGWAIGCYSLFLVTNPEEFVKVFYFAFVAIVFFASVLVVQKPSMKKTFMSIDGRQVIYPTLVDARSAACASSRSTFQHHEGMISEQGRWRQKCEFLANRYALSNRQREVFLLLAKGRNVKYIQDILCVSSHTVKSHIYSIYKKLDVHSQQELIDMVEKYSLNQ